MKYLIISLIIFLPLNLSAAENETVIKNNFSITSNSGSNQGSSVESGGSSIELKLYSEVNDELVSDIKIEESSKQDLKIELQKELSSDSNEITSKETIKINDEIVKDELKTRNKNEINQSEGKNNFKEENTVSAKQAESQESIEALAPLDSETKDVDSQEDLAVSIPDLNNDESGIIANESENMISETEEAQSENSDSDNNFNAWQFIVSVFASLFDFFRN